MSLEFVFYLNFVEGCKLDKADQEELISIFKESENIQSDFIGVHTINGFLRDVESNFYIEEIDVSEKEIFYEGEDIPPVLWYVGRYKCY